MIEKPKRPTKPRNQERQPPRSLQELIERYDLDNIKIYDFLDGLVDLLNQEKETMDSSIDTLNTQVGELDISVTNLSNKINPLNWTQVTLNSTTMSQGGVYYVRIGNLVIIDLEDLIARSDLSSGSVIATGFPNANRAINFMITRATASDPVCRVQINTSGEVVVWYDTMASGSGNNYYGQVAYVSPN